MAGENQRFQLMAWQVRHACAASVCVTKMADKVTHQWQPISDGRVTFGIQDCRSVHVLYYSVLCVLCPELLHAQQVDM